MRAPPRRARRGCDAAARRLRAALASATAMFFAIVLAALGGLLSGRLAGAVAKRLILERDREPRPERDSEPGSERDSEPGSVRDSEPLALDGAPRPERPGEPRPERDRLVMGATAVLFALVAAVHHDDAARLWLGLALIAFLVPLTLVDLRTRLLPNKLTLPAAGVAVALGLLVDESGETGRLLAGLAAGGFFFVVAVAYPQGMGLGDVKLAAVLGLFLGREVAAALAVALVAGVVIGVLIMGRKGIAEGRKTAVPFGPFLALGGAVAVLFGEGMVDAYLDSF
jgi:leader peptidase (prepilin peptidase)/N-methyltransferase